MTTASLPGNGPAFDRLVAAHQPALLAHCYRMTGSLHDAEDALQETLVRAWRALDSFEGRSSLRTWLFRIATNASLRVLEQRRRRVLPVDYGPAWDPHGPVGAAVDEATWVTPFPGSPPDLSPAARYESRESVELAFVAALQALPGRQRAVLLLRDVLGFSAAETAEALESSLASVNSALNRARRTMASGERDGERDGAPDALPVVGPGDRELVARFVAAWVDHDVAGLVALLAADVEMTMPPMPMWFRGVTDVEAFLRSAPLSGRLQWQAREVEANGQAGFALYSRHPGPAVGPAASEGWQAHSLNLLRLSADRVSRFDAFLTPDLFPAFGLAPAL